MAANDEIPRGFRLLAETLNPGTATITLAAMPGISHVIDEVTAIITAFAAAAGAYQDAVQVNGGNIMRLALNGGVVGKDSDTEQVSAVFGSGSAVTIAFAAATPVNYIQTLIVKGHELG